MEEPTVDLGRALEWADKEIEKVVIPHEVWGVEKDYRFTLVGRVLTKRSYNFEALKDVLARIISPGRGMTARKIEGERFTVDFTHQVDVKRAIEGGPWVFDKHLVILNDVKEGERPRDVELN
ncbi:hypothetical protein Salat_2628600 [Sesamum alatum]|uniref:DUF4283 domain-containing protein n=1 Tax=Sesamum alatum TaxID=300844 RepID=A0AAE1XPG2_9LAMI|nr:hypothetical protein Salat_2628600 [Sesamum alatum]